MEFTDDNLKKWKEWCESFSPQARKLPMIAKEEALLSRLEAAENVVFSLVTVIKWMRQEWRYKNLSAVDLVWLQGAENCIEIWRKTCGKAGK